MRLPSKTGALTFIIFLTNLYLIYIIYWRLDISDQSIKTAKAEMKAINFKLDNSNKHDKPKKHISRGYDITQVRGQVQKTLHQAKLELSNTKNYDDIEIVKIEHSKEISQGSEDDLKEIQEKSKPTYKDHKRHMEGIKVTKDGENNPKIYYNVDEQINYIPQKQGMNSHVQRVDIKQKPLTDNEGQIIKIKAKDKQNSITMTLLNDPKFNWTEANYWKYVLPENTQPTEQQLTNFTRKGEFKWYFRHFMLDTYNWRHETDQSQNLKNKPVVILHWYEDFRKNKTFIEPTDEICGGCYFTHRDRGGDTRSKSDVIEANTHIRNNSI